VATILVADDLASIRRLFRFALPGHTLLEAATGDEALALLVRHRPDIAFLDIRMDGLSGDQVCRAVRADPAVAATRIVLMSAHARPDVDRDIAEAGADFFLRKPFIVSQLFALIA
jgi:CheY-like chemotaxis protein